MNAVPSEAPRTSGTVAQMPVLGGAERFFGHNRVVASDRRGFLERIVREAPAGSAGCLRFVASGPDVVIINDPHLLQELLIDKAKSFDKSLILKYALEPLGGEGLFTSDGELWRRQRKWMAPLFHPKRLESYGDAMVAVTKRAISDWKDGETRLIHRDTTRIAMSIAGKTLFDADTFTEADEIGHALTDALDWTSANSPSVLALLQIIGGRRLQRFGEARPGPLGERLSKAGLAFQKPRFFPGKQGKKLVAAIELLDARVQRMIDERRAAATRGTPPNDLLSQLLMAHDEGEGRMSDRQVRDEILTLFVAGHETTASGLAWTLALLGQHPEILRAVVAEVDALPGDPTVADLPRLGLTLRVFKEALRLYPPVFLFGRAANEAVTLGKWTLKQDTAVILSPWTIHRRADLWPDPERFDPDRFLPEHEAGRPKTAYLPFGAGPRVCIGNHFAMMEAQLVLAMLLRRFHFALPSPDQSPPLAFGATLRPADELPLQVRRR